jgi:hypothetical protein
MSDSKRARVRQLTRLGEGSPDSREEEGEGVFISPKRAGAPIYSHHGGIEIWGRGAVGF